MRHMLAAAALLAAVTACGQKTAGTPIAISEPQSSSAPSRPKDIDLTGRQRCLLEPADWAGFFIEKEGKLEKRIDDPKGVECAYNTNVGYFGFLFNTTDGVGLWTNPRVADKIDSVAPVLGYPAFERAHSKDPGRCDIIVDVSDGQALDAFASIDDRSVSKLPSRCESARKLAEIAITALKH